jgi:hypothetical protein
MRAAMVGGAGYAAGKRRERNQQPEYQQAPPAAAPPPAAPAPTPAAAPAAMSEAEKLEALKNAKELLDSGVLTQAEFDAQKQKLLNG